MKLNFWQMEFGKMTAMAAALTASGAMAEDVHQVVQTAESSDRFTTERELIEDTRLKASNACNIQFMMDLTALGAVIDNGQVHAKNREKVIQILENLGAPNGNLDNSPNEDLMRLVETMPITNVSGCIAEAEGDAIASLQAIRATISENVANFSAVAASAQEINRLFDEFESLVKEDAEFLDRINALREATLQLRAKANASAAEADDLDHEIETIWKRIENSV